MLKSQRRYAIWFGICLLVAVITIGIYHYRQSPGNPDALWHIVNQKCVPNQEHNGQAAPCREVNLAAGYVVLKDLIGPLQYLLMPVEKITGIESPRLLADNTANFFNDAWQARHYLVEKHDAPIPDSAIALAINSPAGRTQNQLHIHISCLRPDVRQQLDREASAIGVHWHALPTALVGHTYLAKRVSAAELAAQSPFLMLAREVPAAAGDMGDYGLAMAQLTHGTYVLLAVKRDLLRLNMASAEEIQDHNCTILD
ncbi:CDP-diacylglycerol diphosphatase [Acerihabitans sp. TG2]|uniref:CDP-diacylglycerol diphosphatase n=1 Tax=Acerihabitans sp. TG2 TaxID=3096008 RepID=UPI002B22DB8B|nr:CDP-diacylglycerol diphosphatase [Acerihabitans sp. TG2]MEA9389905.1 CDP-diacylglycerol diphosphatase [Acerihabitans sp. TG2]